MWICCNQSTERTAVRTVPCPGPIINALTNTTAVSVIATIEDNTEVTVPRRTTRSQSARLNLAATFEGFVPANNPNAWRDRDLEYSVDQQVLTLTFTPQSHPTMFTIMSFIYVIDIRSY